MAYLREYKVKQELTSKEVFAERKVNLENAYKMAIELVRQDSDNDWNQKALAWCLIDLIKKEPKECYIEQLNNIPHSAYDDILTNSKNKVLRILNPLNTEINQAKELSQSGKHKESANLYFRLIKIQPDNIELQTSFAWELYRLAQEKIKQNPINIEHIKRYFDEYFKLNNIEKPSILHHCLLHIAVKLIENQTINKNSNIDFVMFCIQWDLNNLNDEDYYERKYSAHNGEEKSVPPLALTVFRLAIQQAINQQNKNFLKDIISLVESKIQKIRTNIIWLRWDLVKAYHFLGDTNKALSTIMPILKAKPDEYWIWDFLGDIYFIDNDELSRACYCKALLLQKDIKFVSKIKMKLVYYFIYIEDFDKAKTELREIIEYNKSHSQRVSSELQNFQTEVWYLEAKYLQNNRIFYERNAVIAEQLLYQDLPWISVMLGDVFEHNGRLIRKLFVNTSSIPVEISILDEKIKLSHKKLGQIIKVKGEWNKDKKFQIYTADTQLEEKMEFFESYPAVIDHINPEKGVAHFLINERVDTVMSIKELPFSVNLYDIVNLKLSQHTTREGKVRYKIYEIMCRNESEIMPINIIKTFKDIIEVNNDNGFGNDSNIFIPSSLVKEYSIKTNSTVEGKAIRNYNKKRNVWGWKAFEIFNVVEDEYDIDVFEDDDDVY